MGSCAGGRGASRPVRPQQPQARERRADYARVRTGSFSDMLDEALAGERDSGTTASHITAPSTYQPVNPFLFAKLPHSAVRPAPYRSAASSGLTERAGLAEAQPPSAVRQPARTLNAAQQQALDTLIALGAELHADFTARELRREYRLLARRIHPDRHHAGAGTECEQQRLSRQFAMASDSYRRLLTIVDPRH